MFRPHSALLPWTSSYRRLSDILWPAAAAGPTEAGVEYLGEDRFGNSDCSVLAIRQGPKLARNIKCLLWLAKDRNLIPVRFEEYRAGGNASHTTRNDRQIQRAVRRSLVSRHKTRYIFRRNTQPTVGDGCLFVDQVWDYSVQEVSLNPAAPSEIFSQIVVPEEIVVQYFDKSGHLFSKIPQTADAVPEMPPGK